MNINNQSSDHSYNFFFSTTIIGFNCSFIKMTLVEEGIYLPVTIRRLTLPQEKYELLNISRIAETLAEVAVCNDLQRYDKSTNTFKLPCRRSWSSCKQGTTKGAWRVLQMRLNSWSHHLSQRPLNKKKCYVQTFKSF